MGNFKPRDKLSRTDGAILEIKAVQGECYLVTRTEVMDTEALFAWLAQEERACWWESQMAALVDILGDGSRLPRPIQPALVAEGEGEQADIRLDVDREGAEVFRG